MHTSNGIFQSQASVDVPASKPAIHHLTPSAPLTLQDFTQPMLASAVLCLECPSSIYCLVLGAEDATWCGRQARSLPPQGLHTILGCLANSYASFKTQFICHFLLQVPPSCPDLEVS